MLTVLFPSCVVIARPLVQVRAVTGPFPAAGLGNSNVTFRIKAKAGKLLIPENVPAIDMLTVPEMQQPAGHNTDLGPDAWVYRAGPFGEMSPVSVVCAENPVDAWRLPIAGERMSHHVVAASGNAGIIEAMFLKDASIRCPGESGMPMIAEIALQ